MTRLYRIVVPNQPVHIMFRGNIRQAIFESDDNITRIKEDMTHALANRIVIYTPMSL